MFIRYIYSVNILCCSFQSYHAHECQLTTFLNESGLNVVALMALRIVTKFGVDKILDIKDDLEQPPDPAWAVSNNLQDGDFIFHSLDLLNAFQHFPSPPRANKELGLAEPGFQQRLLQTTLAIIMTKCLEKTQFFKVTEEKKKEDTVMFIAKVKQK